MFTREAPPAPPQKEPRFSHRTKLIAGLVAILLGYVLYVVIHAWSATVDPPAEGSNGSTVADVTAPAGGWPAYSPADPRQVTTRWTLVGGVAVPSSMDAGPAYLSPVRWGYKDTPAGALFAAANVLGQMIDPAMTPATEVTLATFTLADSPKRTLLIQGFKTQPGQNTAKVSLDQTPPQFVAYHFVSYTSNLAVVDIANEWNGQLTGAIYTLQWERGDWKLVVPSDGHFSTRQVPQPLDNAYYTRWAAS